MALLCLMIIGIVALADLGVKQWVEKKIKPRKDTMIAGGRLILRKVHNKGAMLGFGRKYPELIKIFSGAATGILLAVQFVMAEKPDLIKEKIALALVSGGAISNTFDRIKRGYVVDYIAFPLKRDKLKRITYNIGDFAIFAGVILLLISTIVNMEE